MYPLYSSLIHTFRDALPEEIKGELEKLIDELIGDIELIQATGKTAFARSSRAHPVKGTGSAYTMATSYEEPRGTHGVTADSKIGPNDDLEEPWLKFRKNLVRVRRARYVILYHKSNPSRVSSGQLKRRPLDSNSHPMT